MSKATLAYVIASMILYRRDFKHNNTIVNFNDEQRVIVYNHIREEGVVSLYSH